MTIDAGELDLGDVAIGDSIACNGICLTVTRLSAGGFSVDVSRETLSVTAGFAAGAAINLEKSRNKRPPVVRNIGKPRSDSVDRAQSVPACSVQSVGKDRAIP